MVEYVASEGEYASAAQCSTLKLRRGAGAQVPPGCTKTVWLLDDGKDADKAAWVAGLGAGSAVRYLAGRKRSTGSPFA